ncbi:hypothetical protein GCM10010156_51600 [Planobispora rosea]|uniref:Uncharacterized protein n=1 Tax=Planobispora rosea TaxID=35762 RepID=A0A8J3SAU6_PLARO|nr:hypothetical protein GCM10010156_51600 [Planobispora rosea]GIH88314.1 hypothetical protein Pro02_67220 [Planobispora rosea]
MAVVMTVVVPAVLGMVVLMVVAAVALFPERLVECVGHGGLLSVVHQVRAGQEPVLAGRRDGPRVTAARGGVP